MAAKKAPSGTSNLYCGTCGLTIEPFYGKNKYNASYHHLPEISHYHMFTCAFANNDHSGTWKDSNYRYYVANPNKFTVEIPTGEMPLEQKSSKPLEPEITVSLVFQTKGRKFKVSP